MEPTYIFQALTTAVAAAMAGGLIGWCTTGLASAARRLLSPHETGRPVLISGLRPAHR